MTMRNTVSSNFPQSMAPVDAICIPKAAPLFSTKWRRNQSGIIIMVSSRRMLVFTQIFSNWSSATSTIIITVIFSVS